MCRTITPLDPSNNPYIMMASPIDMLQGGAFNDQRPWKEFIFGDSNGHAIKTDFFVVESVSSLITSHGALIESKCCSKISYLVH